MFFLNLIMHQNIHASVALAIHVHIKCSSSSGLPFIVNVHASSGRQLETINLIT